MAAFETVAKLDDIPDEGCKQIIVRGDVVGLYRVGDDVYALGDVCTHEEAYLTDGDFDAEELEVECPRHGSRFNVVDGSVRILPATRPEPTYEVKIEGDLVLVGARSSEMSP
ncbi:MAG: non-heme iron oxygenase ferredoxin subunit [Actinobacteria bacterium]|nr:non-heme iron oxygenase ferredoxin subunit [Actinomycetota bacterium]